MMSQGQFEGSGGKNPHVAAQWANPPQGFMSVALRGGLFQAPLVPQSGKQDCGVIVIHASIH